MERTPSSLYLHCSLFMSGWVCYMPISHDCCAALCTHGDIIMLVSLWQAHVFDVLLSYVMLYLSRGAIWAGWDVEEQGRYLPKPPSQPKSDLIIPGSGWPLLHLS